MAIGTPETPDTKEGGPASGDSGATTSSTGPERTGLDEQDEGYGGDEAGDGVAPTVADFDPSSPSLKGSWLLKVDGDTGASAYIDDVARASAIL